MIRVAIELVNADSQTVTIDLISVLQRWLNNAVAARDLIDQPTEIGDELVVDIRQIRRDYGSEQYTAESWRRIGRQHEMAKRDPSRWRDGPRVPYLQLS
jgi:hypothetical protein